MGWRRRSHRSCCAIVTGAVASATAATLHAIPAMWDAGGNDFAWSTESNWDTNAEPSLDDSVTFPTPVPKNVNAILLSGGETARGLIFYDNYDLIGPAP